MFRTLAITLTGCVGLVGLLAACGGEDGKDGVPGALGAAGQNGVNGETGQDGADGQDGLHCWDLNGDATCNVDSEDMDGDGQCSADDCAGAHAEPGSSNPWYGGHPISKRVHAIHYGSGLNFPNSTVAYNDAVKGRNWDITYPQDVLNCETCHPDGTTSGTWATRASRLPCMGCHDSVAAQAHYRLQTWDPTPNAPWSGDEGESCGICHDAAGTGIGITDVHGTAHLLSSGEYADAGKAFVSIETTSAVVTGGDTLTVEFTVTDEAGMDVVGVTGADFGVFQLTPPATGKTYDVWKSYVYRTETVSGTSFPMADGTTVDQGYREAASAGTFIDNDDGSYSYVFGVDLSSVSQVAYDAANLHRVTIQIGGHGGPTAEGIHDFVPDGSTDAPTRNIVGTAVCLNCHGEFEFHGHGGDRLTVEGCVTCHSEGTDDAQSGESLDMKVMIHKIHAGGELASIPGADGLVFDDPSTAVDESADNGSYALWGYRTSKHEWSHAAFPAVTDNCTVCHTGSQSDVDNWKTVPSREACGSCHDDIDWVTGDGHLPGAQATDTACAICHSPSGQTTSVVDAHNWMQRDPRHTPEFGVTLSVSTPANSTHFVAGEVPVVSVVLDKAGVAIDHTSVVEDDDGKEGCNDVAAKGNNCPAEDGKFVSAYLFVHGPRAVRNPVLTTAARVEIVSSSSGPYDLSATGAALDVVVDGGMDLWRVDAHGMDNVSPGMLRVDVAEGTFADVAAATAAEAVAWLNGSDDFASRLTAYLEDGAIAIRSRNLGQFYALQLEMGAVTMAMFDGDTGLHIMGGYYARNVIYAHADAAEDDPIVAWSSGSITYTLDAVDDLMPGTYVASVEIADRGRINGTDYSTPSVGWVTFQVGTADEEMPVARNCNMCHQNDAGEGFILDFARHNKAFGDDAMDQCGACHDYQSGH